MPLLIWDSGLESLARWKRARILRLWSGSMNVSLESHYAYVGSTVYTYSYTRSLMIQMGFLLLLAMPPYAPLIRYPDFGYFQYYTRETVSIATNEPINITWYAILRIWLSLQSYTNNLSIYLEVAQNEWYRYTTQQYGMAFFRFLPTLLL